MTAMRFNASALILTSRMDIGATIGAACRVAQAGKGWRSKLSTMRRQVPNLCCAINLDGSCRRRAISFRMDIEKKLPVPATDSGTEVR
jgi:hypothetical protein